MIAVRITPPGESVVDRFLRYVRIDTQSREGESTTPSTDTQWTLARMLATELEALGAAEVRVSEYCMVHATIPSNMPNEDVTAVPVIGLLAHVDTSPPKPRRPCSRDKGGVVRGLERGWWVVGWL